MLCTGRSAVLFAAVLSTGLGAATASGATERRVTKLADGVYAIEHERRDGYESGNTTVILGDRQVFVVDAGFFPAIAQEDIAQIRQWTDKPVVFLLNTHFHNDHNVGNRVYMDSFPALTIIAHRATKRQMDMFGPSSARRLEEGLPGLERMLATKKTPAGKPLTADEVTQVQDALVRHRRAVAELKPLRFQSATLAYDQDFTLDLGQREVRVLFLGRGNTEGDAVVYLPKEKIVVAGDLVVHPIPYFYDGYPTEWIQTLERMGQLDAATIVPGHGPILHDKAYLFLVHDLLQTAVKQFDARLVQTRPALAQTVDDVKGALNLSAFRPRFAGTDPELASAFDDMTSDLLKIMFAEASLR